MIHGDYELAVTRERIAYFLNLLARLTVTSRPEEFPRVAGGYRSEVERMRRDIVDYSKRPGTAPRGTF